MASTTGRASFRADASGSVVVAERRIGGGDACFMIEQYRWVCARNMPAGSRRGTCRACEIAQDIVGDAPDVVRDPAQVAAAHQFATVYRRGWFVPEVPGESRNVLLPRAANQRFALRTLMFATVMGFPAIRGLPPQTLSMVSMC